MANFHVFDKVTLPNAQGKWLDDEKHGEDVSRIVAPATTHTQVHRRWRRAPQHSLSRPACSSAVLDALGSSGSTASNIAFFRAVIDEDICVVLPLGEELDNIVYQPQRAEYGTR